MERVHSQLRKVTHHELGESAVLRCILEAERDKDAESDQRWTYVVRVTNRDGSEERTPKSSIVTALVHVGSLGIATASQIHQLGGDRELGRVRQIV